MSESVTIAKKCTSPLAKSETAYRCQQYLRISAEYGKEWYCENGSWKSDITPPLTRERFWLCCALYEAGDSSLADAIIRTSRIIRKEYPFRSTFNIFNTNIATMLLLRHRTRMANDVVSLMEGMVRDGFASYAGNLAPDYQFHGYNDNMPAKALLGLILGGEMLGDSNAVKHGRWSLCQFADMLSRRGINSEYNSPTYTPLTIHALAELGEHALDPEVKKLALDLETHLWLDLASHFHPETGVVAGPYSRAYTVDVCAQVTALSSLLWFVLGESSLMSPMKLFDPNEKLILHHCGNRPFNIAQMCWYAAGVYHLNPALTDTFFNKAYPFSCVATAESGALGEGYPARPVRVETYMQPDFTLGTASTPFLDGSQSAPYFVTYRHQETVRSRTDIDTVFHKFLINDETPGRHEKEHPDYSNSDEQSHLDSHCHITTLQTENTAIVVTCPQTKLTDNGQQAPLKRVSECVLFSARSEGADELIVGTHERSSWEGVVPRGQWIYCRRGRLLIAIRPLVYMCGEQIPQIRLETLNGYELIRTTFYQGESKPFSPTELQGMYGGFIAEHASIDEYDSLGAFAMELESSKIIDYFWMTRRVCYRRATSHTKPAIEMELSWTPGSPVPRFATINHKLVEWPRWQASDPSLQQMTTATPMENCYSKDLYFPWEHLDCVQMDWPWAIGDRG